MARIVDGVIEVLKILHPYLIAVTEFLLAQLVPLATLLTAIAALMTVREMRNQRIEGRKPELLPPVRQSVHAEWSKSEGCWSWKTIDDPGEKIDQDFSISLFNIGNGPAKALEVFWEYPFRELASKLNSASKGCEQIVLSTDDTSCRVKYEGFDECFDPNAGLQTTRLPYVLPSGVTHQPVKIPIPTTFRIFCEFVAQLYLGRSDATKDEVTGEVTRIQMRLTYQDLAESPYEQAFCCRLDIYTSSEDQFDGELEFRAVSR